MNRSLLMFVDAYVEVLGQLQSRACGEMKSDSSNKPPVANRYNDPNLKSDSIQQSICFDNRFVWTIDVIGGTVCTQICWLQIRRTNKDFHTPRRQWKQSLRVP